MNALLKATILALVVVSCMQLILARPIQDDGDDADDQQEAADEVLDRSASVPEQSGASNLDDDEAMAAAAQAAGLRWNGRDELGELGDEPRGLDSNIANAKISMTANDMATAAGHHHHHHHYPKGWLEMGAETGKKGAFKWHDKHPVGGKGRR